MSDSDILIDRVGIADHITNCLKANLESMREQFHIPGRIPSCFVDDVLPDSLTRTIFEKFPPTDRMIFKNTLREKKFIAVQLNHYDSVIEESIYAFQDSRVDKDQTSHNPKSTLATPTNRCINSTVRWANSSAKSYHQLSQIIRRRTSPFR